MLALAIVCGVLVLALGITVGVLVGGGSDKERNRAAGSPPATNSSGVASPVVASSSGTPTAAASDFAEVFSRSRSGVVRIDVVGCTDSGVGSGFLLSPTLVATVAHVVDEAAVVSLSTDGQRTTGKVIGLDADHDLALVRAASPLSGHTFRFASRAPRIGERVAAIGFPIGDPITLTQGGISGLGRDINVDGVDYTDLVETDAAINPGNSGGPLLAADGTVLGLVDAKNTDAEGIAYAVPAALAKGETDGWRANPDAPEPASCRNPLGPDQSPIELTAVPGLDPDASSGVASTLVAYFNGINTADYDAAYYALSPRKRSGYTSEQFSRGLLTSYDSDLTVLDARQLSATEAKVALQFVSLQSSDQGPDGDTCDIWTLVYRMVYDDGSNRWLIDDTLPYKGQKYTACE